MSMKLNAGNVGRQDLFSIDPAEIKADHSQNGRAAPQADVEIEALARSVLAHGQLQPALVRRIEDHRVQLVAGYGRLRAIAWINAQQPDKPLKLQCRVVEVNQEEALVRNIAENLDRAETTPIDDAHNQRRLREHYGWADERIAEFYKRSVSHVRQLRKTLTLSAPIQQAVAHGDIPLAVAMDLTDLPESDRAAAVQQATGANGHVNGAAIRERVRQSGKTRARTLSELRAFLGVFAGEDSTETERTLASALLAYLAGNLSEDQATAAFAESVSRTDVYA